MQTTVRRADTAKPDDGSFFVHPRKSYYISLPMCHPRRIASLQAITFTWDYVSEILYLKRRYVITSHMET